jgi:hypothetical protein
VQVKIYKTIVQKGGSDPRIYKLFTTTLEIGVQAFQPVMSNVGEESSQSELASAPSSLPPLLPLLPSQSYSPES